MERTDDELLEAARGGDEAALQALLARHAPSIYRFGRKMCRDPEDAKDVLQDTLLAAFRGLRDLRGDSAISTWLYTVARSFCIKKRRRSKHAPAETLSYEAAPELARKASPEPVPEQAAADSELRALLEGAIDALEPKQREVLLLRDVEGLTASEVARVLGLRVPAVKSRLHRARMELRARLEPHLRAPERPAPIGAGCPETVQVFSRYLEGEIGPEECAAMQRHVEACPACAGACESLRKTLTLCRASRSGEVPADVQALIRRAVERLQSSGSA